jgi:hypothetical protein
VTHDDLSPVDAFAAELLRWLRHTGEPFPLLPAADGWWEEPGNENTRELEVQAIRVLAKLDLVDLKPDPVGGAVYVYLA